MTAIEIHGKVRRTSSNVHTNATLSSRRAPARLSPGQDSDFTLPLTGRKAKGTVSIAVHLAPVAAQDEANVAAAATGRDLFNHANNLTSGGVSGGGVSGGGVSGGAAYPGSGMPTVISKGACKAVLARSTGFKIADTCDTVPDEFTVGLAWAGRYRTITNRTVLK